jgi:TldD protein
VKDLLEIAVNQIKSSGADYGDARIGLYQYQNLAARDMMATNLSTNRSEGIGIQARVNKGWGFSATQYLTKDGVREAARKAVSIAEASSIAALNTPFTSEPVKTIKWQVSHDIDPFTISVGEKLDLLMAINKKIRENPGIKRAIAMFNFTREHKLFMNTDGSYSDQLLIRVDGMCSATAVGKPGFESRHFILTPLNTGYEHIQNTRWLEEAERIAEEAVQKLNAPQCTEGQSDLIILPSHTCLVIHETIGHATELDRIKGWEADMAGTSFATTDKLKTLQYGSEIFNVVADRTMKNGRSSVPMDDEGVETGRWHLIKNGILTGYSTTRGTAHYIDEQNSRGCAYADSWSNMPILRMPNVSIEPGDKGSPTLDQIVNDTTDGYIVDGMGSFSIDHQRINFQFGGDAVWRVENGKKKHMVRGFTYQSRNPMFWRSVDAICPKEEWCQEGVVNCGKGQPMQTAQLTHGSAPMRLRNITVGKARI